MKRSTSVGLAHHRRGPRAQVGVGYNLDRVTSNMCTTPGQCGSNTPYWMHVRRTPNIPFQAEQVEERTEGNETVAIRTQIYRDAAGRMRFEWNPYSVLLS